MTTQAEFDAVKAAYRGSQVDSAGQIAADDGAGTVSNVVSVPDRVTPADVDTGTNDPIVTTDQSQATPPLGSDDSGITAPQTPGVGAGRDDTAPTTSETNQIILNANLNAPISPRPNILDQYASYTYAISWYILTPEQFNELLDTHKSNVNSWELLMQSGGAPATVGPGGRNKYFTLDYYMDNLVIEIDPPGKGMGASYSGAKIDFTVTEPNGLTLIRNLANAVNDISKKSSNTGSSTASTTGNFLQQIYCLAIRFYGYDATGNLVYPIRGQTGGILAGDPAAIVQRFYPFNLVDITFRLMGKAVEYSVSGIPVVYNQSKGEARGTIPFNIALTGKTVDDVLNGKSTTNNSNGNNSGAGREASSSETAPSDEASPAAAAAAPEMPSEAPNGILNSSDNADY